MRNHDNRAEHQGHDELVWMNVASGARHTNTSPEQLSPISQEYCALITLIARRWR